MSGIVGILNLAGAPVDRALLSRMTDFMTFRGPDAQETWVQGNVGFGHTLLKTTYESEHEQQPLSLDGHVWIVADARIDARADLIRSLGSCGQRHDSTPGMHLTTDVELILRAYHAWDEDCVDHLLGDFAFAIWDGPKKRLFCARDHFGVKPFVYARLGRTFIFSNTLDCIRQHPAVSNKLNESAVADFLLFDMSQDAATTSFADIQCLPPAHTLMVGQNDEWRMRRYWTLPVDEPIYYRRKQDYVDRFKDLLRTVIQDRVRTDRVAVYMSGGLDSTSAAAFAQPLCDVQAYTVVYDSLIPDEERRYSGMVAKALGIPIRYRAADDYELFERWDDPEQHCPELGHSPLRAIGIDQAREVASYSRVAFYCEGPDNALRYEWGPYMQTLLRRRKIGRLTVDLARHFSSHRRLPLVGCIWNRMGSSGPANDIAVFPEWINTGFASRMCLRDRWEASHRSSPSDHPYRPKGYASFALSNWRRIFEEGDPSFSGVPVETRHPFMDLRMLRYLLAVPPIPWCRDKHLLRSAMQNTLPEAVRRRPKTALAGDPITERLKRRPGWAQAQIDFAPRLFEYVQHNGHWCSAGENQDAVWKTWINLRPYSLNHWLQTSPKLNVPLEKRKLRKEKA